MNKQELRDDKLQAEYLDNMTIISIKEQIQALENFLSNLKTFDSALAELVEKNQNLADNLKTLIN